MANPSELKLRRTIADGIDVVTVGGVAGGQVLRGVKADADFFVLRRPEYIKPLSSAGEVNPDLAYEEQVYELHVLELVNSDQPNKPHIFGIAVVEGETLTGAFTDLVVAYVEKITAEHVQAGHIQTQ